MSLLKQMSQSYEYSFNPEMTENKQTDFTVKCTVVVALITLEVFFFSCCVLFISELRHFIDSTPSSMYDIDNVGKKNNHLVFVMALYCHSSFSLNVLHQRLRMEMLCLQCPL